MIAVIAGAFGFGHARGTSKAEAKADKQRTEENAAATVCGGKNVKLKSLKEASNASRLLITCLMTTLIVSCETILPPVVVDTALVGCASST